MSISFRREWESLLNFNSMKTIVYFLLLFWTVQLSSQNFSLGLKLGLGGTNSILEESYNQNTVEQTNFDEFYQYNYSSSLNLTTTFNRNSSLAVILEPGIVTKGYRQKESNFSMTYLFVHLPVSLSIRLSDNIRLEPSYELGLIAAALGNLDGDIQNLRKIGLLENVFESSLGLAIKYQLTEKIDLGLKYARGLSDITNLTIVDFNGYDVGTVAEKSQYFQIFIGYHFYETKRNQTQ